MNEFTFIFWFAVGSIVGWFTVSALEENRRWELKPVPAKVFNSFGV